MTVGSVEKGGRTVEGVEELELRRSTVTVETWGNDGLRKPRPPCLHGSTSKVAIGEA